MIISDGILVRETTQVGVEVVRLNEALSAAKATLKSWPPKGSEAVSTTRSVLQSIQVANDRFQVALTVLVAGLNLYAVEKPADYNRKLKKKRSSSASSYTASSAGLLVPGEYDFLTILQACIGACASILSHQEACLKAAADPTATPLQTTPGQAFHVNLWDILETNANLLNTLNGVIDSAKWYLAPPSPSDQPTTRSTLKLNSILVRLKLVRKVAAARRPYNFRPFKLVRVSPETRLFSAFGSTSSLSQKPMQSRLARLTGQAGREHPKIFRKMSIFCVGLSEMLASGLGAFTPKSHSLVRWLGHSGGNGDSVQRGEQARGELARSASKEFTAIETTAAQAICNRPRISGSGLGDVAKPLYAPTAR